jgi:cysteine desulfurase
MNSARRLIYLDHNATTPLSPSVRAAMARAEAEAWGNPSSLHAAGRRARAAVEQARAQVAALLGATSEEIVFTSGGTEADNLGVRGLALEAARPRAGGPPRVLSSRLEHPAVRGALAELAREGFVIDDVPVGPDGRITIEAFEAALRPETVLASLALVNHELGTINPIPALAAVARARGVLFHSDAVQAVGRLPVDVEALGVDALSASAHKLHGPKGVGALYLRRGRLVHPVLAGGHQERERRAGTENVLGIVGFGAACAEAAGEVHKAGPRIGALRDRLEAGLRALPGARRHGGDPRAPGTLNLGFEGADGQMLVINLDLEGICASTGAACTSGSVTPSPVLLALGLSAAQAREAVRFSLGRDTTEADIDAVLRVFPGILDRVRAG